MLLSPWGRRWWLFLSATTLRGSVAPLRPRCPPSSRYGSASGHRTSPAPPVQTLNTSRKSATELCFIPFLQQNLTFIGEKKRETTLARLYLLSVGFFKVVFCCCFASFWHFRVSIENWTGEGDHRHLEYASSNVLQLWLRTLIIHCFCRCFLFYFFK